jgi:TRAP-type mannitol/chloroaromatic compound transport system permease small subunit
VVWLVLVMVLISAGNALVRYGLKTSSNAWLEVQWYLFAAVFLLSAGATLLANGHVRIDVLSARLSSRTRLWIDFLGGLFFLLPVTLLILWLSWPMALESFLRGEMSSDAGGLPRWPAKMLIPAGFLLLALQGVSETIKRADALRRGDE